MKSGKKAMKGAIGEQVLNVFRITNCILRSGEFSKGTSNTIVYALQSPVMMCI